MRNYFTIRYRAFKTALLVYKQRVCAATENSDMVPIKYFGITDKVMSRLSKTAPESDPKITYSDYEQYLNTRS